MESNQKPDETPKKKAAKKKSSSKKAAKKKAIPSEPTLRMATPDEVEKLIRALASLASDAPSKSPSEDPRTKKIQAIHARVQEFMSCFMLIGYLDDGTPVNIYDYESPLEADALSTLLTKIAMGGPYQ